MSPSPSSGFPDASNTGVPAGTVLTVVNGDQMVSTPGSVIDGEDIRGCVWVNAPGVVIRNSRIVCAGGLTVYNNAAGRYHGGYTGTGLVIQDSEVACADGSGNPTNGAGISDTHVTALRVNLHGCEHGLDADDTLTIEDSYIHDLYQCASCHTDGLLSWDGTGVTIRHNTILSNDGTSSINVNNNAASGITTNGLVVDHNLLAGGAYTLYCPIPPSVGVQITDNRFSRQFYPNGGEYGPMTDCQDEAVVTGNVWDDTGTPVPVA